MALTVNIGEAKTRSSELIVKVEAGEEVIIARGNEPVARLAAIDERARRRAFIQETLAARDSGKIKRVTQDEINAWIDEARR